jgi:3-oxoacyl-[acyl-carrier-protein] synthase-1/3-oxoacyl-[acyl-carrier-protein] synthase II
MTPVAVVACGAVSALGTGESATAVGAPGERPRRGVRDDPSLRASGLKKPRSARALGETAPHVDRARRLLAHAARELAESLDAIRPGWRGLRLALAVGTSAGGLASLERALALRARGAVVPAELARAAFYDGPLVELDGPFGAAAPRVTLLGACIASTFALGLGARWLDAERADLVIAGGYDALTSFLASGFEALGATTAGDPAPFRSRRDGMALGEGAALVALMRPAEAPRALGYVLGFGASSDATHVTAPDPQGRGLVRAARAALADASVEARDVDLVSAHATATAHNDAAEARALELLFGASGAHVPVHPFKAVIGHTLGAAGALETLAALGAMRARVLPGAAGDGAIEPGFAGRLLEANAAGPALRCLKLSAAFGGANAALVLAPELPRTAAARARARPVRLVHETERVTEPEPELIAQRSELDELRRTRLDRASALAVTAVARALSAVPELDRERAAVVLGTFAASLEADEEFDARRRERGASAVEPRRFPATSPNLPAGWCTIAFGLRGPSVAVGGGPGAAEQAELVGYELVAAGDAEYAVVVVCDDVGAVTRDLAARAGIACPEGGACARVFATGSAGRLLEVPRSSLR